MSRRESLVGQTNEDNEEIMVTAVCRRDSLSESNEIPNREARIANVNNQSNHYQTVYDTAVNNQTE